MGCATNGHLLVWDLTQKHPVGLHLIGPIGRIAFAKFSPDGTRVLSATRDSDSLHVWDLTRSPPKSSVLRKPDFAVCDATFAPSGTQIMAAFTDRTLRIWKFSDDEFSLSVGGDP